MAAKQNPTRLLEISPQETEELLKKIDERNLEGKDYETIKAFICTFIRFKMILEQKKASIKKLMQLVFGKTGTEKAAEIFPETKPIIGEESQAEIESSINEEEGKGNSTGRKGHGRNGARAYVGAEKVTVPHPALKKGDTCPECQIGRLYAYDRNNTLIRITGSAPLTAVLYVLESSRCALCGKIYKAPEPLNVGKEKYDASARAIIVMLKYGNGFPYYRLGNFQKSLGVPMPASTQYDIAHSVYKIAFYIFEVLVRDAAQGELIHIDDTTVKILSVIKENKAGNPIDADAADWEKRKATFTSGIISIVGPHEIVLFFSGRKYAGENLDELLRKRILELEPPLQMCDALARNYPKEFATILLNCMTHGRRKFTDLVDSFPVECRFAINIFSGVYRNDEEAREQSMTPRERLHFHQEKSKPLMEKLKHWFLEQFTQKLTEPNSNLGSAIKYMLKHWEKLTGFLRVEGAPLDNNCMERALKLAILNRKNAYFYKTENGAKVGDVLMSLIATCIKAKGNPYDYLIKIQKYVTDVINNPERWVPWKYQETIAAIESG